MPRAAADTRRPTRDVVAREVPDDAERAHGREG
jgi:hypothetical protein